MDYAATIGPSSFVRLSSWRDNLVNFINSLGTAKDPTTQSQYYFRELDRFTLENAYRSDWIARIVIDAPAEDATREWRNWQASGPQIEALEEVENEFRLQQKVKQWIQRARLYGGAALVLGIDDGRESWEEVDLDGIKKDSLQFVVVMNRYELMAGPRIYNVSSPWYTRPEFYTVSTPLFGFYGEPGGSAPGSPYGQGTGMPLSAGLTNSLYARPYGQTPPAAGGGQSNVVRLSRGPAGGFGGDPYKQVTPPFGMIRLHPSRVVELAGNELPDWRLAPMGGGWGDSVLQTVDESLKDWGLTVGSIANMTNDAKVDVVKIKDFTQKVQTAEYKQKLLDRWMVANLSKSTVNALLLDTEEEWQRIQTSFGGLAELMREYMVVISGATGIPISRLFGQSSGRGLGAGSSGGEQDMVNYYDRISQWQRNTVKPAMTILDQALIRSTFGKPIKSIHYDWAPLWQMSAAEKGKVWESKAHVYQIDVQMGLINEDALRRARVNQLVEDGVYPGLEAAIDEFGEEPDIPEARVWSPAMGIDPNTGMPVGSGGGPAGAPGAPPGAPPGAQPPPQGGPPKPSVAPPGGAAQAKPKDAAPSQDYEDARNVAAGIEARPHPSTMTGNEIFAEMEELDQHRAAMKVQLTATGLNALSPSQIKAWHSNNPDIVADKALYGRQLLLTNEADIRGADEGYGSGGDYAFLCLEPFASTRRLNMGDSLRPFGDENPNHDPHSGQFTSGPGGSSSASGGIKSRIGAFVKSDKAKEAIQSAVRQVIGTAKERHGEILASAVSFGLYHLAGIDFPMDVESALHHEIANLATNLNVSNQMAHQAMKTAVGKLKSLRGIRDSAGDEDHDLDAALSRLGMLLDKIEPHYKGVKDAGDWDESKHPRGEGGKFTEAGGGGIPAGLSKTHIVKHLLMQPGGTTTAEILKHTGWTAVTVPGHAAKHGLDITKTKNAAGETVYKGTPKGGPSQANKESDIQAAAHAMSPKAPVTAETHVAAAVATPKPEAATQSPTLPGQQIKGFENADKWTKVSGQTGSNPGGTYKDEQGQHWYVKTPPTADHAMNEVLTGKLYALAGANVPETKLVGLGNKVSVASKMIEGGQTLGAAQKEFGSGAGTAIAQKDFAADAWLGNRDSVGLDKDNMIVKGGSLYRIDHGGGMQYRAQGQAKEFGSNPTEFHTLRDPTINKQAADVFGKMTNEDLGKSIGKVLVVSNQAIENTVHSVYSGAKAEELTNTLIDRKVALAHEADKLGEAAKAAVEAKPESTPAVLAKAPQATEAELAKAAKGEPDFPYHVQQAIAEIQKSPQELLKQAAGVSDSDISHAASVFKNAGGSYANVPPLEAAAVRSYTGGGFVQINNALRAHEMTVAQHAYMSLANKGLDKLDDYEGPSERRTSISGQDLDRYQPGKVIREHGYMSSTKGGKGSSPFSGNVRFLIDGKTGKYVNPISKNSGSENEVLFKTGTHFLVTNRYQEKNTGITAIHMREVKI